MEPVSFAVGLIGLAGLFTTCLDAADRIDSWLEYDTDYRALQAQYNAQKIRLERWGLMVGLQDFELSDEHNILLDDPQTSATIKDLLLAIEGVCRGEERTLASTTFGKEKQNLKEQLFPRHAGRDSKRDKLRWALGAKAKRVSQVEQFTSLVENLHDLVPIEDNQGGKGRNATRDEALENRTWKNELREILQTIEAEMQDEIRRDVHAWLVGSVSPSETYETFVEKRIEGTCDWVLDKPWFLDWMSPTFPDERAKILWINGPAGFGKSITCARITDSLTKKLEDPLGHFFISSDFEDRNDPLIAVRSWLSQLLQNPVVFALVREVWSGRPEQKATRGDTLKLLQKVVTAVPRCTFVLDGLDECCWAGDGQAFNEDNPIIEFLNALRKAVAGTPTRILIVSRDEPEIRSCLSEDTENQAVSISQYKIRPEDVHSDVEAFSRSVVNKKLSSRPGPAREDIAQRLANQCNGQFLWVKMQEDHLRSGKSQKKLEQAINSTPPGLEHTYDRNWVRISNMPEDDRDRTVSLLRWAAFAFRPLSVSEITGALSISRDCDEVQLDELPDSIDEDYLNTEILELCGSLVEIRTSQAECEPGLRTVHLAHFSVKQYLLCNMSGQGGVLQANASLKTSIEIRENTLLAKMCLCYVDSEDVWQESPDEEAVKMLSPFRDYAAGSWHQHANIGNIRDDELVEKMNHLFDSQNVNWKSWKNWFDLNDEDGGIPKYPDDSDDSDSDDSGTDDSKSSDGSDDSSEWSTEDSQSTTTSTTSLNPLYYASWLGLVETTDFLLNNNYPVDEGGTDGNTPLITACRRGHLEIVKKLIDKGADLTITNDFNGTALEVASFGGHYEVVKFLIEKGAQVTIGKPLHSAVRSGHCQVTQLLLDSGADYNLHGPPTSMTPMNLASENGHIEVAQLLLKIGADIEIPESNGATPLYLASINGHTEMVRLLLSHGAKVNATNNYKWTPVNAAADSGFSDTVKVLIEGGADIELATEYGQTAFYSACTEGRLEVVRMLIDQAEINCQNRFFWTAVNSAAKEGFTEIVKLLFEKGANIETPNRSGQTAIYSAATEGHTEVVRLLIDKAELNCQNENGWTPMNSASKEGFFEIVKLLVEKGADLEIPTHANETPLYTAATYGHEDLVRLLLFEHGAKITPQNKFGWTAVNSASKEGFVSIVKMLLEKDADIDIPTKAGETALYSAATYGHEELVRLFLDLGANLKCQNKYGWTAINSAAKEGFLSIVEMLLEKGVDIEIPTVSGQTPIYSAATEGHTDVVRLLMSHGANLTSQNEYSWTAVNSASKEGSLDIVKLLLEKDVDINIPSSEGWTALYSGSSKGDPEIVRLLLSHGAKVNDETVFGWTPLIVAASKNHLEVFNLLLEAGAVTDHRDEDGGTALLYACEKGNLEIVKILLERKADVKLTGKDDETALSMASAGGYLEIVKLLLEQGAVVDSKNSEGWTPLMDASSNGHLEVVKLLLDNGADPTASNTEGWAPLQFACRAGSVPIMEYLLEKGSSIHVADIDDYTPLHAASSGGHPDVVKFLVEKGASVDACDNYGTTALNFACRNGDFQTVEFLIESGGDPRSKSNGNYSPLHGASEYGHPNVVKLLMKIFVGHDSDQSPDQDASVSDTHHDEGETGPNIQDILDLQDKFGRTPLWYAAMNGNEDVIETLLPHSPSSSPDRYGTIPLCVAVRNGHEDTVKKLVTLSKHESDFEGGLGRNLLWWAAGCGQDTMMDTVRQFALEIGIENPEPTEGDKCTVIKVKDKNPDRYCDICTRFIPTDNHYMTCQTCDDFDVCIQCSSLKAECFDSSHEWKAQEPDGSDSDSDSDSDTDSSSGSDSDSDSDSESESESDEDRDNDNDDMDKHGEGDENNSKDV